MNPIIAFEIAGLLLIVGYVWLMRWSDARRGIKLSWIVPIVAGMIFTKLALTATTSPVLLSAFGQGFLVSLALLGVAVATTAAALMWMRRSPDRALTAGSWLILLGMSAPTRDGMATSTPFLLAIRTAMDIAAIAAWAMLACGVVYLVVRQVVQQRRHKAQCASTTSRQDITNIS